MRVEFNFPCNFPDVVLDHIFVSQNFRGPGLIDAVLDSPLKFTRVVKVICMADVIRLFFIARIEA